MDRTILGTLNNSFEEAARTVDDRGFGRIRSKGDAALFGGRCTEMRTAGTESSCGPTSRR
jgi:hypothetical protein